MKKLLLAIAFIYGLFHFIQKDSKTAVTEKKPENLANDLTAPIKSSPVPNSLESSSIPGNDYESEKKVIKLFQDKKYLEALDYAESLLKSNLTSRVTKKWISNQLNTLNIAVGFYFLNKNDCSKALGYFSQAHTSKQTVESIKGISFCNKIIGSLEQAESYLDQAFSQRIFDLDILRLHKEVKESTNNLIESEEYYTSAIEHYKSLGENKIVEELEKELETIRKKYQESKKQDSFNSNNFFLKYRDDLDNQIAINILEFLEASLIDFTQKYLFPYPQKPIEVVLYSSNSFFSTNSNAPVWAEGLYDGRLRIPIKKGKAELLTLELKSVLKHELIHALLDEVKKGKKLAPWFEEGLAQYFSCKPNCRAIRGNGLSSPFLPQNTFETPFTRLNQKEALQAYTQSLFMIYYLDSTYGTSVFPRIIEHISQSSEISSNSILSFTTGQNFNTIYRIVRSNWKEGNLLSPRKD